jgi:hypothetical protein
MYFQLHLTQILKKKWEYNETVHQLFVDFRKAYDSVRREVLYNILPEFGVPMKLVRLIKMYLNETFSKVRIGKHLFDSFPIQNSLKQEDALYFAKPRTSKKGFRIKNTGRKPNKQIKFLPAEIDGMKIKNNYEDTDFEVAN